MTILTVIALLASLTACTTRTEPVQSIVKLAAPSVSGQTENGSAVFYWNGIENANRYSYELTENGVLKKKEDTRITSLIVSMEIGAEYSLRVKAMPVNGSKEYAESDWSATVTVKDSRKPDPDPVPPGPGEEVKFLPSEQDGVVRAFPGAEGCGMFTTGGRGGKVIHVTNLNDSGAGSLRAAIGESGTRTIVFDVAGTIELQSRLEIKNGNVTIAGQTAPGDGICLKNHNFRINTSNVIVRFIRCRMGDVAKAEDDAMNCYGKSGYRNVIIDHCSISWSTDECGTFYGVQDFTLQYCILSESLRNSVHDKGKHGYGGIWGGQNATFHHNLLAHHDSRNPRFDHDFVSDLKGPVHFVNNVVYNWGDNSGYGGESAPGSAFRQINMLNNYYKPGPASKKHPARIVNPTTTCKNCCAEAPSTVVPGKFYVAGNYVYGSTAVTEDNWIGVEPDDASKKSSVKALAYMGSNTLTLHSAPDAFSSVLGYAGASLCRDAVDRRIENETLEGKYTYEGSNGSTGGLIDTQSDVGGWPEYKASAEQLSRASTDSDSDGIPDYYETLLGLNPKSASDALSKTLDPQKLYTNFECYLHYLVQDVMVGETVNGKYTKY